MNELSSLGFTYDDLPNAQLVSARVGYSEIAHAVWAIIDSNNHRDARIQKRGVVRVYTRHAEVDMSCTCRLGSCTLR